MKKLHFVLVSITLGAALVSCTKNPTEGTITVVNLSDNSPVAGAKIHMYVGEKTDDKGFFPCNGSELIKERVVTTGSSGSHTECFKHPAVITLEVSYTDGATTKSGVGKLTLVDHENTKTTVTIN